MKIRLVGGGLAAVLAVLSLSSQARAASAAYFQDDFNSYDYSTASPAYLNTDTGGGDLVHWFSVNATASTVTLTNQANVFQTYSLRSSNYTNGKWYTISSGNNVNPRFTLGHYTYQTNSNTGSTPGRVLASSDESPFSQVANGSGLNMMDARTNDGPSRRMGVQWNVAEPGNLGDGSGRVVASFDFIMHDTVNLNFTGTGSNNYAANQDNLVTVVRLFDSQHTATTQNTYTGSGVNIASANQSGLWLQFMPVSTATSHDATSGLESYANGGGFNIANNVGGTVVPASTGFADPNNPTTPMLFSFETWYHIEIDASITYDGTLGSANKYSLTVAPWIPAAGEVAAHAGTPMEMVYLGNNTTSAIFRDGATAGYTQHMDSLWFGTTSPNTAVGDYSFDNLSIVPEPATMGLLTLGAALLLPRRRQHA